MKKFSKQSKIAAIAVIVVIAILSGMLYRLNDHAEKLIVPVSHHATTSKVVGTSTTQESSANPVTASTPVASNPTAAAMPQAKTTPPTTSQSPVKIVPQPTIVPTYVTSATVTILNGCAGSYTYTVGFIGTTSFTFSAHWEIISGAEDHRDFPLDTLPTGLPMPGSAYAASASSISDTKSPGLPIFTGEPYAARIHVTSPSDLYSNTVNIPDTCQY